MIYSAAQIEAATACIRDAIGHIANGKNEDVVRQNFTSHLRSMFPSNPAWIEHHIAGGEAALRVDRGERVATGFVDNLVNLTAIEYESNLLVPAKYQTGLGQVKEYCAGLAKKGHP